MKRTVLILSRVSWCDICEQNLLPYTGNIDAATANKQIQTCSNASDKLSPDIGFECVRDVHVRSLVSIVMTVMVITIDRLLLQFN